ncbi:hypothetical protein L6164_003241 [Bauhinia variegata]|uniref:Uncharacterized protein n=1 Tax=Bauhinia variegata TaxID=167791 RepID=A0ACB9PZW4_BAUVA|nr:hypothetical protein L6164_003241 [Bauhinia variegata]
MPLLRSFMKFFAAGHTIFPISALELFSVDILEGEWGTEGSIIIWKYFVDGKAYLAKEVVETIDKENNSITFNVLEGDLLQLYKSFKFMVQVGLRDNGSRVHWIMKYEKLHDHIPDPYSMIEPATVMVKDIDAYLIQG